MKILVLAAFIAAVTSGSVENATGKAHEPWQAGKLYRYDVESSTIARLHDGASGSAFKARFTIRVPAPGRLLAKLEDPKHALVRQDLHRNRNLPQDLSFEPVEKLDQPFEILVEGGRVSALKMPASLPLAQENLLKGLISALQVDLSANRLVRSSYNGYDEQEHQGMFKKMETDVTGDCETLYNVNPAAPQWRFAIPKFANDEEPMMVTKVKNYGHCHHRVEYHFGIPDGSEWSGAPHTKHEEQLVRRSATTRMLVGKQAGPIYKTEVISTVHVNPQLYGKQKAEVQSKVVLQLVAYEQDSEGAWSVSEEKRNVNNLLYSVSQKQVQINDRSSESSESNSAESAEQFSKNVQLGDEYKPNRIRRYVKSAPEGNQIKQQYRRNHHGHRDYDRSSSASVDSTSAFVNDDLPDPSHPAYAALYLSPTQPDQTEQNQQNHINVQKLVQDMAQQLQNPNNMPKLDFLSKFNIVVRILASMNSEQLAVTSRSMENTQESKNVVKADMWMIYRDAMAQVGTMPAFQQIKSWIENKKIEGEEAAEVVASLVGAIRYPSKEIMTQFFNLAISENVRQQKYLNNTALIAATRLINMAQVNNETAHSYYPTHMYGRFARHHDAFVTEEVLPRLAQELKQAVEQGDSSKAQVYIKAIGNLGHSEILRVFAPYLEGKVQITPYLREKMIKNLRVLAFERNAQTRAVLYAILRNVAERYEARVAAIQNIFMADPSTAMLAGMAQMTHNDPSIQVRAVLKSGILSAAQLRNKRYSDLSRRAQAVQWMVTKQEFGAQYSNKYLNDYHDHEQEYSIITAFSQTGSESSFFPRTVKYALKSNSQGWSQEQSISASASDVQELYHLVEQNLNRILRQSPQSETEHKYSAEKLEQMLNIKRDPKNPLEASITINLLGQERFFTLSESDLQQLPAILAEYSSKFAQGTEQHYTKVLNQAQVSIMFPVAAGMPFIFKYKEPMVIHVNSKIAGKSSPTNDNKQDVNIETEMQVTYARNIDGSVGFMDTFVNQYAQVGITSKLQIQVPLKLQLQNKEGHFEVAVEYLHPEQDKTLAHYSVWPYSSLQKKDALVSVSLDQSTKSINKPHKTVSFDYKFGQSLGQQYQLQGYSYSTDYNNYGTLYSSQYALTNLANLLYQRDVALTHFNFKYLGKQSQAKRAVLTFAYDKYYNQKEEASNDQPLAASNMADTEPNSNKRRNEIAQRVISGISNAKVQVLDISASIEGRHNQQFVATAAMASSLVSPKVQYAIFLSKNSEQHGTEQLNAAATVFKPLTSYHSFDFEEAIAKDMKTDFNIDVKYGKNGGNVHIQGSGERTKKRTEELKKHPRVQECQKQFGYENGNQNDCYEMLLKAHTPDYIKASVTYKDVSPAFRNMTYKALRIVDHIGYWYADVNPLKVTPEGKIELESHIHYPEKTIDIALATRMGALHLNNVPIPKAAQRALTFFTPLSPATLMLNYNTDDQYEPLCYLDSSRIWTFSNRKYEYSLTNTWHVVMQDHGKHQQSNDDLALLAKMAGDKQMHLYISYKSHGQHVEAEIQPGQEPNVKTNAKKLQQGDVTVYFDEANHEPLFEYHKQTQNTFMFNIRENRLHALFDGQRLVLIADQNRNNTYGLCGRMSGELRDDFYTPTGVVKHPEHYGASYALQESDSDPKTMQLKEQAKQASFQPKHEFTAVLPANEEWRAAIEHAKDSSRHHNMYKTRSFYPKQEQCKVDEQVQYFEDQGQICISDSQLPACQSHCRGEGYKARAVQVVCGPKSDKQFQEYREQIRQGQNPKPNGAPNQQPAQFRVPASCRA